MVSYAEYHKNFHEYANENALTANSRALYAYLLGEFNAVYWKKSELSKSVRDVRLECGFKSESTVQRAKAELGTENIIKIIKRKNSDVYILTDPAEWKRNKTGTSAEHVWNTSGTLQEQNGNASITREKDIKDKKTFRQLPSSATATTTGASAQIEQTWLECTGETPKGGVAIGLNDLAKLYDEEKVVTAIYEADRYNSRDRISFALVKKVLENGRKGEKPYDTRAKRSSESGWGANRRPPC